MEDPPSLLVDSDPPWQIPYSPLISEEPPNWNKASASRSGLFVVGIQFGTSELYACDSVYAASFAAGSDAVYLASYSGRVVLVDHNGQGQRAYDIGSVPTQIIDRATTCTC